MVFFQEDGGTAPVAMWLAELRRTEPRAFAKCVVRLERLRSWGMSCGGRRPTRCEVAFVSFGYGLGT